MGERLLTSIEVAELLNVSVNTVYKLAEAGEIPAVRIGVQFRFERAKVQAWIDSGGNKKKVE